MRMPAICDTCGTIFPSGIEADNSSSLMFQGCTAGPCPRCGERGHIPDGVYNFIGGTMELLSGPSRTVSELQRLAELLRKARAEGASPEEVGRKIQAEVPGIASLKDLLPQTKSDFYSFISIVISIIGLILTLRKCPDQPRVDFNQVVNVIYQQEAPSPAPLPAPPPLPERKAEAAKKPPKLCIPKKK
jgi:hypothetical protein